MNSLDAFFPVMLNINRTLIHGWALVRKCLKQKCTIVKHLLVINIVTMQTHEFLSA